MEQDSLSGSSVTGEPWLVPGHFMPGDAVVQISLRETDFDEFSYKIVDSEAGPAFLEMGWRPSTDFTEIRHFFNCAPCQMDLHRTQIEGALRRARHWESWSPEAHRRWRELVDQIVWQPSPERGWRGTFTAAAVVPGWLREHTAGSLTGVSSHSELEIAAIAQPLDWPTLLDQHHGDLEVVLPDYDAADDDHAVRWEMVAAAYRALVAAGHNPVFDAELQVGPAAQLQLSIGRMICDLDETDDRAVIDMITGILDGRPYEDVHPGWGWDGTMGIM